MPTPKTRVRRATVHLPASEAMPVTVRGIGWQADCTACGGIGKITSYRQARANAKAHTAYHAIPERLSLAGPV